MASRSRSLPSRFPVGTKFIIEGRPRGEGKVQVSKRYIEFPDGSFIRLPVHPLTEKTRARRSRRTSTRRH